MFQLFSPPLILTCQPTPLLRTECPSSQPTHSPGRSLSSCIYSEGATTSCHYCLSPCLPPLRDSEPSEGSYCISVSSFQVQVKENLTQTGLRKREFVALLTVKIQGSSMDDLVSLSLCFFLPGWLHPQTALPCGGKRVAAAPAITSQKVSQ